MPRNISHPEKTGWILSGGWGKHLNWAAITQTEVSGTRPVTKEREQVIMAALDELAKIFDGKCDWMLTGGLSIAITLGKFYRDHDDVDIAMPKDGLAQLVEIAGRNGYRLFERKSSAHLTRHRRITFFRPVTAAETLCLRGDRLRLIRVGSSGWRCSAIGLLDFLDIYPYEIRDGRAISCNTGVDVSLSENYGPAYRTASGLKIPLRGMGYIGKVKQTRIGAKSGHDVEVMRRHGLIS